MSKQITKLEKAAKSGDKELRRTLGVLQALETHLSESKPARTFSPAETSEQITEQLSTLLTTKPTIFVANVAEDDAARVPDQSGTDAIDRLAAYAAEHRTEVVVVSGRVESEIAELPVDERTEYLQELGLQASGLDRFTLAGYRLLDLLSFFTVGPKEAHAWTVPHGTAAPQAAGKIHTDFEKGFIRAEVISYDDYVACKGEAGAREKGKLRVEGKEYIVEDGDVVHFRFNV